MARPTKCRHVEALPGVTFFKPRGVPLTDLNEVQLTLEGYDALRLVDIEGLNQSDSATRMGVSRQTFGRILSSARQTVARAVVQGMALRIDGGNYVVHNGVPFAAQPAAAKGRVEVAEKGWKARKIAVSSLEPGLDAPVDARFGRATGFVIVDPETMEHSYLDNPAVRNMAHGAGTQTADMVGRAGVEVVLTGFVGPKAFAVLAEAGIRAAQNLAGLTVREAVERFKSGDVEMTDPDD